MEARQAGTVSRAEVLRALGATRADVRHRGGEAVIDLHGLHFRLGARRGVDRVLLRRLERRMASVGYPVEAFRRRLFRLTKGTEADGETV
jgi:hypothetical protein